MSGNSSSGVSNVPTMTTTTTKNSNNSKQFKKKNKKKQEMNKTKSKKKRLQHNNNNDNDNDDDDDDNDEAKQSVMNLRRHRNNNRISFYVLITIIIIAIIIIATTIVTTTSSVTASSSSSSSSSSLSSSSTTTTTTTTTTTKSIPLPVEEVEAEDVKMTTEVPPPPPLTSNNSNDDVDDDVDEDVDDVADSASDNNDSTDRTDWTDSATIMTDNWTLLKKFHHDPLSFTQGLEVVPFHIASTLFDNYKAEQQKQQQQQQQEEDEECSNVEEDENDDQTCNSNTNEDTPNPPNPLLVVESTGMYGDSLIRIWEPTTGTIIKETSMNQTLFGEGLCFYTDTILLDNTDTDTTDATSPLPEERDLYVQLTYREQTILIYDAHTLELLKTIQKWPSETTTKEGWGITYNPTERIFYVTDGSDYIHYWNRQFQEIRPKQRVYINELITYVDNNENTSSNGPTKTIIWPRKSSVDDDDTKSISDSTSYPINYINELEYDITTNTILANKIFDDIVLRIDPNTGLVLTVYNFNSPNANGNKILYPKSLRTNKKKKKEVNNQNSDQNENDDLELELAVVPEPDVFNGIAIIPNTDGKEWLLTGKYWNSVYYIRINE